MNGKDRRDFTLTSLEMRNLIFDALAEDNPDKTPWGMTFKMYGYAGCVSALRALVEYIAIEHGMIDKIVEIPKMAWGVPDAAPNYMSNSNLDRDNLNLFNEEVHLMIYHNILSPGAIGGYGDHMPYFHVTKYGLKCLEERDVLPYDPDAYLKKISTITSVDEWEKFYIEQSLKCYNADAFESALIMIGLAGEYLATKLIENMDTFLSNKEPMLQQTYANALKGKVMISQRYTEYEKILERVIKEKDIATYQNKYPALKNLSPSLDIPAKAVYATYLRLTRNELAHPTRLKVDRVECLTLMTSYIKYCETQHKYLDFYIANS